MPKEHKFKPGDVVVWGPWAKQYSTTTPTTSPSFDFNMNTWPDQPPFLVVESTFWHESGKDSEACRLVNVTTGEPVLSRATDGLWYWEWLELDPFLTAIHKSRHGK